MLNERNNIKYRRLREHDASNLTRVLVAFILLALLLANARLPRLCGGRTGADRPVAWRLQLLGQS